MTQGVHVRLIFLIIYSGPNPFLQTPTVLILFVAYNFGIHLLVIHLPNKLINVTLAT